LLPKGFDHRPEGACAEGAAAKPRERREWAGSVGAQGVADRTGPGAEEALPQRERSKSLQQNQRGWLGLGLVESLTAGLEKPGGLARVDRRFFFFSPAVRILPGADGRGASGAGPRFAGRCSSGLLADVASGREAFSGLPGKLPVGRIRGNLRFDFDAFYPQSEEEKLLCLFSGRECNERCRAGSSGAFLRICSGGPPKFSTRWWGFSDATIRRTPIFARFSKTPFMRSSYDSRANSSEVGVTLIR